MTSTFYVFRPCAPTVAPFKMRKWRSRTELSARLCPSYRFYFSHSDFSSYNHCEICVISVSILPRKEIERIFEKFMMKTLKIIVAFCTFETRNAEMGQSRTQQQVSNSTMFYQTFESDQLYGARALVDRSESGLARSRVENSQTVN